MKQLPYLEILFNKRIIFRDLSLFLMGFGLIGVGVLGIRLYGTGWWFACFVGGWLLGYLSGRAMALGILRAIIAKDADND